MKYIQIDHQIQYRRISGRAIRYASETKTSAGKRKLPITAEVAEILAQQREINSRIHVPEDYSVDGYHDFVFLSPKGTCLSHNTVRCMMSRLSRDGEQHAISIRHVSPHICRHTYITELASKGCDIKVLQALVGQKDLRVTYAVYNHLDNGRVYAEMQRLGLLKSS